MTEQPKPLTVVSPFMARFVTKQTVVERTETSTIGAIVSDVEFTWLAEKQGSTITPEDKDVQAFMARAAFDNFVPFGVFCKIHHTEGSQEGYLVNKVELVFTANQMNEVLRKNSSVIDTGLWRTDAAEERSRMTALFGEAMQTSPLYKTLSEAGLEPKVTVGELEYVKSAEGPTVLVQPVELTISYDEYINRFGAFARFVKQHDLKEFNIPALSMA